MRSVVLAVVIGSVATVHAEPAPFYGELSFGLGQMWGEKGARPPDVSVSASTGMRVYRLGVGAQVTDGAYTIGVGPVAQLFESKNIGFTFGIEALVDRPLTSRWRIGASLGVGYGPHLDAGSLARPAPGVGTGISGQLGARVHNGAVMFRLDAMLVRDEYRLDTNVVGFGRGFGLIGSVGVTGRPGSYAFAALLTVVSLWGVAVAGAAISD